jgi:hypothetical protein
LDKDDIVFKLAKRPSLPLFLNIFQCNCKELCTIDIAVVLKVLVVSYRKEGFASKDNNIAYMT